MPMATFIPRLKSWASCLFDREVLDFIRFLKSQRRRSVPETVHASEAILRKEWLLPEEDEAWSDL